MNAKRNKILGIDFGGTNTKVHKFVCVKLTQSALQDSGSSISLETEKLGKEISKGLDVNAKFVEELSKQLEEILNEPSNLSLSTEGLRDKFLRGLQGKTNPGKALTNWLKEIWSELGDQQPDPIRRRDKILRELQGNTNLEKGLSIRLFRLLKALDTQWKAENNNESLFDDVIAVGIALPAPVSIAENRPLAPSGGLKKLFGLEGTIAFANPLDFHKLDFQKAVRKYCNEHVAVVVMNDGVADLRDSNEMLSDTASEGITVVFKLGTGLAIAVYQDGVLDNSNNEISKAIHNLRAPLQNEDVHLRFQSGVLGDYCSKKAFDYIKGVIAVDDDDIGRLLGRLLESVIEDSDSPDTDRNGAAEWLKKNRPDPEEMRALLDSCMAIQRRRTLEEQYRRIRAMQDSPGNDPKELDQIRSNSSTWDKLSPSQKLAVAVAARLGNSLADGIALTVDTLAANEVRLAGGPLSGATGVFAATAAKLRLEQLYGFDLTVFDLGPEFVTGSQGPNQAVGSHRSYEVRSLRLVYPPAKSLVGGARGAARAALARYQLERKALQLHACREYVVRECSTDKPFSVAEIKAAVGDRACSVTESEIEQILSRSSAVLELTRESAGRFRKTR